MNERAAAAHAATRRRASAVIGRAKSPELDEIPEATADVFSDARLVALARNLSAIAWRADRRGRLTHVAGWEEMTGQPDRDAFGRGWLAMVHPSDRRKARVAARRALAASAPTAVELRVRSATDGFRWMLARGAPIGGSNGRPLEWIGTLTDIDDRRMAEQALREGEERLRLAIESAGLGTFDYDVAAGERRWSPEFRSIVGLAPDERADFELFASMIHAADRAGFVARYHGAFDPDGERLFESECRIRRANDGAERWIAINGRVLFSDEGRPTRAIGTLRDVTAAIDAQIELHAVADRLRLAVAAGGMGTWDYDAVSRRIECGGMTAPLLGIAGESGPIAWADWAEAVHPDDRDGVDERLRAIVADGEREFAVSFRTAADPARWLEARAVAVAGHDGRVARVVGILREITGVKLFEAERDRARAHVRALLESMPDAVLALDGGWRVTYVNAGARRLIANESDPAGAVLTAVAPELANSAFMACCEVAMAGRASCEWEATLPHTGEPLAVAARPLDDGIVLFIRSLALARAGAAALRDSEDLCRFALNAGHMVAWHYEPATRRIVLSEGGLELVGNASLDLDAFLERVRAADRLPVSSAFAGLAEGGGSLDLDFALTTPDGRTVPVGMRGGLRLGPAARPRFAGVITAAQPAGPHASERTDHEGITGTQIRAARGILRWSVRRLASAAKVSESTVKRFEETDGFIAARESTITAIRRALERSGIAFVRMPQGKPGVVPR